VNNLVFANPIIVNQSYNYKLLETNLTFPSGLTEKKDNLLISDLGNGNIYLYNNQNNLEIFYKGLPFGLDVMGYPTGPYKIKFYNNKLYISQGWADVNRFDDHEYDHSFLELDKKINVLTNNLWNPYDFSFYNNDIYLIDSGKNNLIKIDNNNNFIELLFFDKINQKNEDMEILSPTEFSDTETYLTDSVPTGITISQDGTIYVSIFGGFPYFKGSGKILQIDDDINNNKKTKIFIENLNSPVDIEFLQDGNLAILEMGTFNYETEFEQKDGKLLIYDFQNKELKEILKNLDKPQTILQRKNGDIVFSELSGNIYIVDINK
tara:strand:- start:471 stop:1433 length:963 start_codon:yes stop_codon:yes gene_type:complete